MLKNYLFRIEETGEEIICEAGSLAAAEEILEEYFDLEELYYICELSDYEAEMSGLDVY
jgi:hypothetical protein